MKREELIAYDEWLTGRKWGAGEIISPEMAADLYLAEHPLPPAEGAELDHSLDHQHDHPEGAEEILDKYWNRFNISVKKAALNAMRDFATLHAQRLAEKMEEASQFILDIARVLGMETDGVGFDGLTLSIDDFKEAADKMVEEKMREELMAYDKFLSNTYWGVSHLVKRDEAVDEYLKSREP